MVRLPTEYGPIIKHHSSRPNLVQVPAIILQLTQGLTQFTLSSVVRPKHVHVNAYICMNQYKHTGILSFEYEK